MRPRTLMSSPILSLLWADSCKAVEPALGFKQTWSIFVFAFFLRNSSRKHFPILGQIPVSGDRNPLSTPEGGKGAVKLRE